MRQQQPKVTTGNQDSTNFSTLWKNIFHSVEKPGLENEPRFPAWGPPDFSRRPDISTYAHMRISG